MKKLFAMMMIFAVALIAAPTYAVDTSPDLTVCVVSMPSDVIAAPSVSADMAVLPDVIAVSEMDVYVPPKKKGELSTFSAAVPGVRPLVKPRSAVLRAMLDVARLCANLSEAKKECERVAISGLLLTRD